MGKGSKALVWKKKKLETVVAIAALSVISWAPNALAKTDKYRLVWNDDPATTMVVAWDQISGESPRVHYDTADRGDDADAYAFVQEPTRVEEYRGMNNHFAKLTGLLPDTAYYVVIVDSEGAGEPIWFRTAPDKPQPFTFIFGGDTKSRGTELRAGRWSNKMVAKLRPLFVLFGGDFCTGDGTNGKYWRRWLSDWSRLTRSEDGRMYPLVPVHGNHESGDMEVLHRLFDTPGFDTNDSYYDLSFAGRTLQLVTLNSELDSRPEQFESQTEWLEEALAAGEDHWLQAAAYHRPFRPHSKEKKNAEHLKGPWAPLFDRYGVNLSFEAHSHLHKITHPIRPDEGPKSEEGFVRDDARGTMYIGEGSWGAPPRDADDGKDWTLSSAALHQLKWLHVHPPDGTDAGRVEVYTVVTGTYRFFGLLYRERVKGTQALDESDLFAIPKGIKLLESPEGKCCVPYTTNRGPASAPPDELAATAVGESFVELSWENLAHDANWIFVEGRRGEAADWQVVGSHLPAQQNTFTVQGLEEGTSYAFRVRGHNSFDYSNYSNTVLATTDGSWAPPDSDGDGGAKRDGGTDSEEGTEADEFLSERDGGTDSEERGTEADGRCGPREGLVEPKKHIGCRAIGPDRSFRWVGLLLRLVADS